VRERTLCIIKPDAVAAGQVGQILARLEKAGFEIVALRMRRLSRSEAEGFYHVHRERPFFASLAEFMSSGPCVPMVLEADGALVHRGQPRPRVGRGGDGPLRDRLLLPRGRARLSPGPDRHPAPIPHKVINL
jgi:hypothetical protein